MAEESILKKKIERIESVIDLSKQIDEDANSIQKIKRYYRINNFAYRLFHSKQGFMHFRVTKEDTVKEEDMFYQLDVISKYIKKDNTILELGPGQGANLIYLAAKHPDANFIGVDLFPDLKKSASKNIKLYEHDYSELPFIESESIDLVYGIETIVHNSNKSKVFKEVYRILKKGGVFIIYDYALMKPYNELQPYEQTAMKIISKGGASAMIESQEEWKEHFKEANLKEISITDLHKELLPDLKQLERKANHIMKSDRRIKLFIKLFSKTFFNNILLGWLGYDAYKEDLGYYNEWIYKKD